MSDRPGWRVELLDWVAAEPFVRPIREAVFIQEQGVPVELEWDGLDPSCVHALVRSPEGTPIGTARMRPDGKIGRMAVRPAWRRRGVGTALLDALLREAGRRGLVEVTLDAQTRAIGFYRKRGFAATGAVFLDAGIPHRTMHRTLEPERTGGWRSAPHPGGTS
ncbi:GNAT family N-acetyltransferase [Nitrospira sp. Kam-Ns4a]